MNSQSQSGVGTSLRFGLLLKSLRMTVRGEAIRSVHQGRRRTGATLDGRLLDEERRALAVLGRRADIGLKAKLGVQIVKQQLGCCPFDGLATEVDFEGISHGSCQLRYRWA